MERRHICIGGLFIVVIGGAATYLILHKPKVNADSDTAVGSFNSISGYTPVLPIHSRSRTPTQAIYSSASARYKSNSIPARNTDYYNPANLYPSTGPVGLKPSTNGMKVGLS